MNFTDNNCRETEEMCTKETCTESIETSNGDSNEEDVSGARTTGQVKWFNDNDGYGFIKPSDNSADIFVHISDIQPVHNNFKPSLYTGEYVSFALSTNGQTSNGSVRLKAVQVKGAFGPTWSLLCDHGDIEFKTYSRIGFSMPAKDAEDAEIEPDAATSLKIAQKIGQGI